MKKDNALRPDDRLAECAGNVCWYDWSDNDRDALETIYDLRSALHRYVETAPVRAAERRLAYLALEAHKRGLFFGMLASVACIELESALEAERCSGAV